MSAELGFTPLDLQSWKRGQVFAYFSQMAPTGYSLTVDMDITHMREVLRRQQMKFFPAYLWLVTKSLNRQPEFKLAEKDGRLGYYDTLTPLYAAFHEDDQTFSLMWTEYSDRLDIFYRRYLEYQQLYGAQHGILAQSGCLPPENAYTVSCIPWVPFKHFAVHSYENRSYSFPSVEAGKFYPVGDRLKMPLSLTCHHAAVDGYHVKCFWGSAN